MNLTLYSRSVKINDYITILIPTVADVIEHADDFFLATTLLTSMPIDLMVQLDDIGIDFTQIDDWQLFTIMFPIIQSQDTSLIFDGIDLKSFVSGKNVDSGDLVFYDPKTGAVIDRLAHTHIADVLRKILFLEKNTKRPANDEAKEWELYKARKRMKRAERKAENGVERESQIESLIVSLVNREEFKYDFESVKSLTIYQFYRSFYQILHKVNYDNLMTGCYAGNVDTSKINKNELTWLDIKN